MRQHPAAMDQAFQQFMVKIESVHYLLSNEAVRAGVSEGRGIVIVIWLVRRWGGSFEAKYEREFWRPSSGLEGQREQP